MATPLDNRPPAPFFGEGATLWPPKHHRFFHDGFVPIFWFVVIESAR